MVANFGDIQAAAFESSIWDTEVLQGRYAAAVIMPRILNKSSLVADAGQIVHIPVKPVFVGGTVASDGTFTTENPTVTDIQVNVNTWKYVAIEITDKSSKQSVVTLETEMPAQFGERLAVFYDTDLANLITTANFTLPTVGTVDVPVAFLEDAALTAVLNFRKNNIPLENASWLLPPEAFYLGWLTKERMTNANTTGLPKSVLSTNFRQLILGIPAYESTLLIGAISNTPGVAITGALTHKEALAIAMQINNKYEKTRVTPAGRLSTIVVAQNLYGTKVVRSDHLVPIYVRSSSV